MEARHGDGRRFDGTHAAARARLTAGYALAKQPARGWDERWRLVMETGGVLPEPMRQAVPGSHCPGDRRNRDASRDNLRGAE